MLSISLPPQPRFLIVRLSAIGDCVHGLPVACALRRAFPACHIGWVVEGRTANLLQRHPVIDQVLAVPRGWYRSPGQIWHLRHLVRAFEPTLTLDLQGLTKSAAVAWLSGCRTRIGFAGAEGRELSPWLNTHKVASSITHVVDKNLQLLQPLGIDPAPVEFQLPHDQAAAVSMSAYLQSRLTPSGVTQVKNAFVTPRFALLNPGAGWGSKRWPRARFAAVARELASRFDLKSVIAWAPGEEQGWATEITRESAGAAVLAPPTDLQEFIELARLATVVISGDTGPLHLAAAAGTPCVALFGPSDGQRNGPYGTGHITLQKTRLIGSSRERRHADDAAIRAIQVTDVMAACQQLLAVEATIKPIAA
ncbi:MAG: glycosyltransferase family 9 protein [Pirellulales bacterium]|nr:glycosyltransferase family 9 protein [Pirellulales bacterium]